MDKQKPQLPWSLFSKLAEIYRDIAKNTTPVMQFFLALAFLVAVFGIIWKALIKEVDASFYWIIGIIALFSVFIVILEIIKILSKRPRQPKKETSPRVENESPAPALPEKQTPIPSVKPMQAAESPIASGDCANLQRQLDLARRVLGMLEEQESRYTAATYPAHLRLELEDQKKKVAELEAKLNDCLGK